LAVAKYHGQHRHYPPAYAADAAGQPMHTWRMLILPYLEQRALHDRYDFNAPWDADANVNLATLMPKTYALDVDYRRGLSITNYAAVVGAQTVWPGAIGRKPDEVTDGASNTILIVENRGALLHWMAPRDLTFAAMTFQINRPDEISSRYTDPAVVMLDGAVMRLHADITPQTVRALLTVAGGEPLAQGEGGWSLLPDGRVRQVE
jgi:hypothetical protein